MFELKIRDAKPLFALSVLFVPLDFFSIGTGVGWGLHFPLVRFVASPLGNEYVTILRLFQLRAYFGSTARIGLFLWIATGTVTGLAVLYVLVARAVNGTTKRWEDRLVGAAFLLAGALFLVRGLFVYDLLVYSSPARFSIPFGAVYTIFVGYVFYFGRFRLGAG